MKSGYSAWINPFVICWGEKSIPGCEAVTPLSKLGLSSFKANPFASPSVPGKESPPAPLDQVAEFAFAVKSYAVPVVVDPFTLISTHQSLRALEPIPNNVPVAFLNFQ